MTMPSVAANDEIWASGGWRGLVNHSSCWWLAAGRFEVLPGQWTGLRNELLARGTALPHSHIPWGQVSYPYG